MTPPPLPPKKHSNQILNFNLQKKTRINKDPTNKRAQLKQKEKIRICIPFLFVNRWFRKSRLSFINKSYAYQYGK
ncbi:hypothetical protein DID88_007280 [Monilinia fructigena]|uniref:Uncharacterized protein n=1 Tax=Monilinia fructigena TaxID=38457 RepID=A0A395J7S5_9HELO|nr:hypothetical protein DID88_007280 [Monilinia fructigena]